MGASNSSIKRISNNILRYGGVVPPRIRKLGRAKILTSGDRAALFAWLRQEGWHSLAEMAHFCSQERGVEVSKSTLSRVLRREGWSRKSLERLSRDQNLELRAAWNREMRLFTAEDLVFLDESNFNETTGWRNMAYGPIGEKVRYRQSLQRGNTCSLLAAYSLEGYLPCWEIREGYFNGDLFYRWLTEDLLPLLNSTGRVKVICLDNINTHINPRVREAVESAGYLICYLSLYSSDYNPIELMFSVLKLWIRRWFFTLRPIFDDFRDFLYFAVDESGCDHFAREHFRHAAGDLYIEEEELQHLRERFDKYERGLIDLNDIN